MIDTTMLIGRMEPYNQHRVEDMKAEYEPFIQEFSRFEAFVKWSKEVKKPLLKDGYLAIVREDLDMSRLEGRVAMINQLTNKYVKLLHIVSPRERLYNLEFEGIEVINLNMTAFTDFKEMLNTDLHPIPEDGVKEIIKRIGLSYQTYILYKEELIELKYKDAAGIQTVIKEKKLSPTETILLGVLNREKKYIKEHYLLCEKYSESWVLNHYKSTLGLLMWLKFRVQSGDMDLTSIRISDKFSKMLRLVRDSKITDVFLLRNYLIEGNLPIETYILDTNSATILNKERLKLESKGKFNFNVDAEGW